MYEPGECFVCGCSELDPCVLHLPGGRVVPCGWANAERTLCNNPDCIEEASCCPVCGILAARHTPFMEAGCQIKLSNLLSAEAAGGQLTSWL